MLLGKEKRLTFAVMQTSGPIRQDLGFHHAEGFGDIKPFAKNLYEATCDGKKCLLKTARDLTSLLRREYDISCNLQHPYILTPLRFSEDTPVGPAIVMEYIDGCTLTEFVAKEQSHEVLRRLLVEILDAVDYLHKKGLIHNDLKPENILVCNIGNHIRIIDFGLSDKDAEYLIKRLGGTEGSSAPEVIDDDTDIPFTASSDVWSLGYIISIMFPSRYRAIVRKCRRQNPKDRYPDIVSLEKALRNADRLRRFLISLPFVFCAIALVVLSAYSYHQDRLQEEDILKHRLDSLRNEIPQVEELKRRLAQLQKDSAYVAKIEKDIRKMYLETMDTIQNRKLVPYYEFGQYVHRSHYVTRTFHYGKEQVPDKYQPEVQTFYAKYLYKLDDAIATIPTLEDAFERGKISEDEYRYYRDLAYENKPFKPFSRK